MRSIVLTLILGGALVTIPAVARAEGSIIVSEAQQALKAKGFDPGAVDGVAGAKTRSAIMAYQKANNLDADGMLGPQTLEGLGVKRDTAGTNFKTAGSKVKNSYASGGKEMGEGGKDLGSNIKHGEVVEAGKDFGKGVGRGAKQIGVGTGQAATNVGKGVKKAVTGK